MHLIIDLIAFLLLILLSLIFGLLNQIDFDFELSYDKSRMTANKVLDLLYEGTTHIACDLSLK